MTGLMETLNYLISESNGAPVRHSRDRIRHAFLFNECFDYPVEKTLITWNYHRFKSKQIPTFGVY